jgi:hypothetical protein
MRRLARHLFTLCSAVSLLLFVAAWPMWARSVFRTDYVGLSDSVWHGIQLRSGHATIGFGVDPRIRPPVRWHHSSQPIQGARPWFGTPVFSGGPFGVIVLVPYWVVLTLTAACPTAWLVRRRRRRLARGLCPTCGYDLRAHAPGERCPECGTPAISRAV